jgi:hypothetical protein
MQQISTVNGIDFLDDITGAQGPMKEIVFSDAGEIVFDDLEHAVFPLSGLSLLEGLAEFIGSKIFFVLIWPLLISLKCKIVFRWIEFF